MRVNISPLTISSFLNGPAYQPLVNTEEIDCRIEEKWKVKKKQMGSKDKIRHFQWIKGFIALNDEGSIWVVGGL